MGSALSKWLQCWLLNWELDPRLPHFNLTHYQISQRLGENKFKKKKNIVAIDYHFQFFIYHSNLNNCKHGLDEPSVHLYQMTLNEINRQFLHCDFNYH